ncbi:MAG: HEAT repeat domain-containing protein [Gemmatimonadales bacterium]
MTSRVVSLLALVALVAASGRAQGLARQVERVKDGTVRFSFASRPDVCGNGRGNISVRGSGGVSQRRRGEWETDCEPGPVRVALDIVGAQVVDLRTYVGGRWRAGTDVTDLGTVAVKDAVDYLLDVVARGTGKPAGEAIFPATLADSVVTWPRLLALAKDVSRTRDARHQAVFWVGQAAGERATQGLTEVVGDAAADRDVRLQAVFAISQRPKDEGVPALINIARTNKDGEVRKQAIFWLGQSNDPRALSFFESILAKE